MSNTARIFAGLLVAFHLFAFVVEVFLWMDPAVHGPAIQTLNPDSTVPIADQAAVLRTLFINQGFYNLFLAAGAAIGIVQIAKGQSASGIALLRFAAAMACGAGLVLLATTQATTTALAQAGLGAAVLVLLWRGALPHR